MGDQAETSARTEIIELADTIFDAVDAKNWEIVEASMIGEGDVVVDFTSLRGGKPSVIPAAEFVGRWSEALHARKKSFHLLGHYHVNTDGDTGTLRAKLFAYNLLDPVLGGELWEVWGTVEIPVRRTDAGWKAAGVSVFAWHARGNDYVRTHLLMPG
jgi:hypothetical protein